MAIIDPNKYRIKQPAPPSQFGDQFLSSVPILGATPTGKRFLKGAGKGALETVRGGLQLGLKTSHMLGRLVTPKSMEAKLNIQPGAAESMTESVIPKKYTEAQGGYEKAGKFAEQVAEFSVPLGAAKKYTGATTLFRRAVAEGLISSGVSSVKSGRVGKEAAVSGAVAFAFPYIGAGFKKVLRSLFGQRALAKAAVGLPPSNVAKAEKIAKSTIKVGGKTQQAYDSFDDMLVKEGFFKNGLRTTRQDMLDHANELYKAASASKKDLLSSIKEQVPVKKIPRLIPLLEKLLKAYDDPLLKSQYNQIDDYLQAINNGSLKRLSAVQIDQIRFLADAALPRGAYAGAEPLKTQGLQEAINPLRNFLAGLDTTGQIQRDNVVKRIIGEMLGFSTKNNPMAMAVDKSGVGTMIRDLVPANVTAGGLALSSIPGGQGIAAMLAMGSIAKVIADQPPVASALINAFSAYAGMEGAKAIVQQLPHILESVLLESGQEISET